MHPAYACAIIEDDQHRLLLELRPATARFAANTLTCFGGAREADEDALACLTRELQEELSWSLVHAQPAVDAFHQGAWIARFFRCQPDHRPIVTIPHHHALWIPRSALHAVPLSDWHACALTAYAAGQTRCELPA